MPRFFTALRPLTLLAAIPLAACVAVPPSGPSIVAMPHSGESLTQFQADDVACRNYAQAHTVPPGAKQEKYDIAYAQCMTSKGAVITPPSPPPVIEQAPVYGTAYPYDGTYPYDGFIGIGGPLFWGSYGYGGWYGGWHGGWHGGAMRGTFHGGSGYGGFSHGGGGHSGR